VRTDRKFKITQIVANWLPTIHQRFYDPPYGFLSFPFPHTPYPILSILSPSRRAAKGVYTPLATPPAENFSNDKIPRQNQKTCLGEIPGRERGVGNTSVA
jgi:hypothetical protein